MFPQMILLAYLSLLLSYVPHVLVLLALVYSLKFMYTHVANYLNPRDESDVYYIDSTHKYKNI